MASLTISLTKSLRVAGPLPSCRSPVANGTGLYARPWTTPGPGWPRDCSEHVPQLGRKYPLSHYLLCLCHSLSHSAAAAWPVAVTLTESETPAVARLRLGLFLNTYSVPPVKRGDFDVRGDFVNLIKLIISILTLLRLSFIYPSMSI